MSFWLYVAAIVGVFISAWLVKRRAFMFREDAYFKIERGLKIDLAQAHKEVAGIKNCVYMPGDDQEFGVSWGHTKKLILVTGPRNNISHPAIAHEMGHARIYRQNLDRCGKPLAVDYSKSYVMAKLAVMFWYEYRVERKAWLLSEYWNTSFSSTALNYYGLMALWNDLDVAGFVLFLALLVKLLS